MGTTRAPERKWLAHGRFRRHTLISRVITPRLAMTRVLPGLHSICSLVASSLDTKVSFNRINRRTGKSRTPRKKHYLATLEIMKCDFSQAINAHCNDGRSGTD
jgi:hypothetical protein